MEPNVHFWMTERQSFFQRFLQWTELLDPTNIFISISKIEKSRQLLLTNEDGSIHDLKDKRIYEAWNRSLATVHPDNSKLIPSLFRPAALLPFTAPMVFLSLVPVKSLKSIILPQLSFCTYSTVFNIINGNASYNRHPYESILLGTGVIASTTFFGLFPRLLLMKYAVKTTFLRETLPAVVLTQVSAMNVAASRSFEPIRGIEVMDKEGNVVGCSRRAGTKHEEEHETAPETKREDGQPAGLLPSLWVEEALRKGAAHSAGKRIVIRIMGTHPPRLPLWSQGKAFPADGSDEPRIRVISREQAVRDTATSRVVLFGTSAFIPEIFSHFLKKTPLFVRYPQSLWTLRLSCTILVMGLMVPVSFSMFPQIQRIQCSKLEQEIQSATEETELFYNRGV